MKNLLSAIISVIVFSSAGFAVDNSSDNFTIPHDFSSGETISSQKMNENFNAIQENLRATQELLNKLIKLNDLVQETNFDAEVKLPKLYNDEGKLFFDSMSGNFLGL